MGAGGGLCGGAGGGTLRTMPPVRLRKLAFENYKAFPGREELEIRPITVIIGRNGAGKSAVARLPLAVAAGLEGRGGPGLPMLVRGVHYGNSLLDLCHGGTADRFTIGCTLEDGDRQHRLQWEIERDARSRLEQPAQWVRTWSQVTPRPGLHYSVAWDRSSGQYVQGGRGPSPRVAFSGLVPTGPDLRLLAGETGSAPRVHHLLPWRGVGREAFTSAGPLSSRDCGTYGERTRAVLGDLHLNHQDGILDGIRAAALQCLGIELDVREVGDGPVRGTVVLARPAGRDTWRDITEVGSGLEHALPVCVQHVLAELEDGNAANLLVTEEPEAHLHPRAQADMADVIIRASRRVDCLVETHSETFVLRLRRRVAEGTLSAEHVSIAWVDDEGGATTLRPSKITETGGLEGFPEGWFDCALDEVRAIGRATLR